jgi:aryl-alcohol dehydrogenase-like predicted oxidoreductase
MFHLGTAQLGLDYGVMNRTGKPADAGAFAILDEAQRLGVRLLDTAYAYGDAERLIGAWQASRSGNIGVVTKLPPLGGGGPARADEMLSASLARLQRSQLEGLLLHRAMDWLETDFVGWIGKKMESGVIDRFGVSIYDACELPDDDRIRLIQLPASIFVQSHIRSAEVARLIARGGRVHVRSVFVQGLLLAEPARVPPALADSSPYLAAIQGLARDGGVSVPALAMAAVRRLSPTAELIVGCDSLEQLAELAQAATERVDDGLADAALAIGAKAPERLFDPRRWPHRTAA